LGKDIHDMVKAGKGYEAFTKWGTEAMLPLNDPINEPELSSSIWQRLTDAADRFDNPGYFTAGC